MIRHVIGFALLLGLVAPLCAQDDLDPFFAHVDQLLAEDRPAVDDLVRQLEENPVPASPSRTAMIEGLVGVLSKRGESGLAARVRALPASHVAARGLGQRAATPLSFPGDHGSHLRSFCEWWYFTGNLQSGNDRYGFEVSFFRTMPGIHFVHTALTDVTRGTHPWQRYYVRPSHTTFARDRFDVKMGENTARENERGEFEVKLNVRGNRFALTMRPERAPMIVNGDGVIDMPEGTTSRYYSFTRLATSGTLTTAEGQRIELSGRSWYDHQWGNFVAFFRPWDWFSFQLEDGSDYNLFHFREVGGFQGRTVVNVLRPDGALEVGNALEIARRDWWKSPRTGKYFVTRWELAFPSRTGNETFEVTTPVADQEMPRANLTDVPPGYWEGAIDIVRASGAAPATRGVGYSEHMPYRRPTGRY